MAKEENTPEMVKMTDDTVVEFPGKTRTKKDTTFDEANVSVRFDFRNGEVRTFTVPHFLTKKSLGDPMAKLALKAMGHGLEQKLGDEMSGIADLDDAIEAVDQLMERLKTGIDGWRKAAEGGSAMAGASVLAKAVVEATGRPIEVIRGYLSGLTPKERSALRIDSTIAPIIKRLEDEKAAKAAASGKGKPAIDTAGLLAKAMEAGTPQSSVFAQGAAAVGDAPV